MKISKENIQQKEISGFTLIELVIVIAGLASLTAFSVPMIMNQLKLSKIEEAKALMNAYAADCLGKYRVSTDPADFVNNAVPDNLSNERLLNLGYEIDSNKSKCSHVAIKPNKKNEDFLYAFDFRINSEGKVVKTAIPSNDSRAYKSCQGWAGGNCTLDDAQKEKFAREAAIAKAKAICLSNYQNWLSKDSTGQSVSWDKLNNTCTKKVYAFEGTPVASSDAVDAALQAKYGKACLTWRNNKINSKYISAEGKGETKSPECGGAEYWFHSGVEFTSKVDWTEYDNKIKKQACTNDRSNALSQNKSGKYVYGPSPGPEPCGKVVWLCNGQELTTLESYKTTSCGAVPPPPPPPPPYQPPRTVPGLRPGDARVTCKGVKDDYPKCYSLKYKKFEAICKCFN